MGSFDISGNKNLFGLIFHEDLYKIGEQKESKTEIVPEKKALKTENQGTIKDLAIVVLSEQEKKLHADFLAKILQAINISPEKADIFSREESDKALSSSYKIYISFGEGLRKTGTGIALKMNQVIFEGSSKFLLTDNLSALDSDREKKKALWTAMQNGLLNN